MASSVLVARQTDGPNAMRKYPRVAHPMSIILIHRKPTGEQIVSLGKKANELVSRFQDEGSFILPFFTTLTCIPFVRLPRLLPHALSESYFLCGLTFLCSRASRTDSPWRAHSGSRMSHPKLRPGSSCRSIAEGHCLLHSP